MSGTIFLLKALPTNHPAHAATLSPVRISTNIPSANDDDHQSELFSEFLSVLHLSRLILAILAPWEFNSDFQTRSNHNRQKNHWQQVIAMQFNFRYTSTFTAF
jgi:hypothetical protein